MVNRPVHFNPYEFAIVSGLRAHQLMDGCLPRMEGDHNATTMAQMEVASGKVANTFSSPGVLKPVQSDV